MCTPTISTAARAYRGPGSAALIPPRSAPTRQRPVSLRSSSSVDPPLSTGNITRLLHVSDGGDVHFHNCTLHYHVHLAPNTSTHPISMQPAKDQGAASSAEGSAVAFVPESAAGEELNAALVAALASADAPAESIPAPAAKSNEQPAEASELRPALTLSVPASPLVVPKVTAVAISPDGRRALCGTSAGMVYAWDLAQPSAAGGSTEAAGAVGAQGGTKGGAEGPEGRNPRMAFLSHGADISAVAVGPDSRTALSASKGRVHIWDIGTRAETQLRLPANASCRFATFLDDRRVAAGGYNCRLYIWDLGVAKSPCAELYANWDNHQFISARLVHGQTLIAITSMGELLRWHVDYNADGTVNMYTQLESHKLWGDPRPGGISWVGLDAPISADGRRAVTDTSFGLEIWDLTADAQHFMLHGCNGLYARLAISADGQRAVLGSREGTVRVWDLQQRTCIAVGSGHKGAISDVALTPDGTRALSGGEDGTVCVWDLPL